MPRATPFSRLLVANRGEVALRVMRSARALGYATVAVHSSVDAVAPHVRAADAAVAIGGALPAQSYLCIERIVEAARRSGADAIHPGYGFLAESADFAQACADAGIVFVGPSPRAMRSMADKASAKRIMEGAGVPCVPGYAGDDQGDERMAAEAQRIGWPVMIKASAGGGGRGMRLVQCAEAFAGQLRLARSEARGAFGDDRMLLERALVDARHIEIQILADRHGGVIHLGERDCSVQRRHQKLIEESPSPAVGAALRERMGAVAVRAAQAIAYEGAGTLEFLLDGAGHFHFIEMNTRLQVEHAVTEAVTVLDLVALQLRLAAGEALPLTQAEVALRGHAIEVRLCAEDPAAQFLPCSGEMLLWRAPPALRVDHALDARSTIAPHYDSMIAKIVAHGRDRDEARRRLAQGLAETVALGVATNQAYLASCLDHPTFAAGAATTAFVERHGDALVAIDPARADAVLALAAALLHRAGDTALPHPYAVPLRLALGGTVRAVTLTHGEGGVCGVLVGERTFELQLLDVDAQDLRYRCDGIGRRAVYRREGRELHLHALGRAWRIDDATLQAPQRSASAGGDGRLRASMNGRVVAIAVAVGDAVERGQPLLTLEAMKMEHVHAAPVAGRVKALHVRVGDQVAAQRVVVEVEPI
ncbi:MAG: 3-methylcrotonyl-CoA carboxylase [Burkholderiales bacterium]|nr:3-methylcrotonyl-CoA carboxylase [Burkholderiales bacterium]